MCDFKSMNSVELYLHTCASHSCPLFLWQQVFKRRQTKINNNIELTALDKSTQEKVLMTIFNVRPYSLTFIQR